MVMLHGFMRHVKETAHFGYLMSNVVKLGEFPDTKSEVLEPQITYLAGIDAIYVHCFVIYFTLHVASMICRHIHRRKK